LSVRKTQEWLEKKDETFFPNQHSTTNTGNKNNSFLCQDIFLELNLKADNLHRSVTDTAPIKEA